MRKSSPFIFLLMTLITTVTFASNTEIVKDVVKENNVVLIKPCDLKFNLPDHWEPAPKNVINIPNQSGFMLGRRGLKDIKGHEVIPTFSVLWQTVTPAQMSAKIEGQDVDPLMAYVMDNRPDTHSSVYKLHGMFIWQDDVLALKYALGCEFGAVLNKRPSIVLVVYTINRAKNLGVQIALEVPEEVFPEIREEMMGILKSLTVTSSTVHGKREAFYNKVDDVSMIEFRDGSK
ncbi:MAG: hypothetical protein JXI43_12880 [Tissierellales bacterium]|nr:hypothetical protein [Tissierellales bacterium]